MKCELCTTDSAYFKQIRTRCSAFDSSVTVVYLLENLVEPFYEISPLRCDFGSQINELALCWPDP